LQFSVKKRRIMFNAFRTLVRRFLSTALLGYRADRRTTIDGSLGRIAGGLTSSSSVLISDLYEKRDNGDVVKYYYADNLRIAMRQVDNNDNVYYMTQDNVGSTALVTDLHGNSLANIHYSPFGQMALTQYVNGGAPRDLDRYFAGYLRIGDKTDVYYAAARFYSADVGRFLSPDPVASANYANPQSLNPYSYVLNNPLTLTDPTGAVLQDTGPGGSIASAVLPALGIVGLDPTANALNGTCTGSCYHSAFSQLLNTAWAADALRQNGVDVNLLLWSGVQREMLANIYPGEVKYGWQSPSTSDEGRYTSSVLVVAFGGLFIGPGEGAVTSSAEEAAAAGSVAPDLANLSGKITRQMEQRGWTSDQIQNAFDNGEQFNAINKATGGGATRYINPETGQSVVIDNSTGEVIHVGGPGFQYGPGSGDAP
jgi:RHS repeat-associated protein